MLVSLLARLLELAERAGEAFFWVGLIIILVMLGGMLVMTFGTALFVLFFT